MFKELVELFKELSATTKRLEMTIILSDFLKKVNCETIGFVVLLCMGKVFPTNTHIELGVANNIMIDALSLSSGVSKKEVLELWKKIGDLGEVSKKLMSKKKQVTLINQGLSLENVKENLYKIPTFEGKGSIDLKLKTISKLLSLANEDEALFLTRIILGSMRTGVGKGVLRDSLASAFNVEPAKIENAYNLCTDFSFLATQICKNPKNIDDINLKLFTPVNVMLFQKVKDVDEGFEKVGKPAIIQVKYDGIRAQIHKKDDKVIIFTRNLDDVTTQFPDAVKYVKEFIISKNIIFECEMVAFDSKTDKPLPFQALSKRIKRKYDISEIEKKIPVKMFCFDLLMLDNKTFIDEPFINRHETLIKQIKNNKHLMIAKGIKTSSEVEALKLFNEGIQEQEGVMFKKLDAKYQAGSRVGFGVKLKSHMKELDLVITEAFFGKGRRKDWFGSFTLSCYDELNNDFLTIGKLGTGFSDEQLNEMNEKIKKLIVEEKADKVIITPDIVVEVEYEEIQKSPTYNSGYALRFPRLLRIREDKKPHEANSIKFIESLL